MPKIVIGVDFDVKEIIRLAPAKVTVLGVGFDKFALKEFTNLEVNVVVGEY
jgi:hypothetical protein